MRIAICEDENMYTKTLSRIVNQWSFNKNHAVQLSTYTDAESLLTDFENGSKFDLLFLDIQLPGVSGLDLAYEIRKSDRRVKIVFVSSYFQFALQGYEVRAYDFLRKPVKETVCNRLLDEVFESIQKHSQGDLIISAEGETTRISKTDIMYLEADGHHVSIHLESEEYRIRRKFSDILLDFPQPLFVRSHRGYIVNMLFVHSILRDEIRLTNGKKLVFSRPNWHLLNQCFLAVHVDDSMSDYVTS